MTVATDEIYEKYLQKAITEINALGDEVAQAGAGVARAGRRLGPSARGRVPAQVRAARVGAAGRASRSTGAPATRCSSRCSVCASTRWRCTARTALKFADGDEDESRPFLLRELHIVQPKLVVAMGEPALAFLNSRRVPARRARSRRPRASCRSSRRRSRRSSRRTSTTSLDEQPAKTRFWNAFKLLGEWWASLPPY